MARGVARPNSVVGRYTPGHYWSNQWPYREANGLGPFYDVESLFRNGEQGGWYDPSDLSSMFQDSAGTTPAAIGQPVGKRLDKSGNGNHLIQATAASRALLSARVNQLVLTEDFTQANWFIGVGTKSGTVTASLFFVAGSFNEMGQTVPNSSVSRVYKVRLEARQLGANSSKFKFKLWNGASTEFSPDITLTDRWAEYSFTFATTTLAGGNVTITSATGNPEANFEVKSIDFRLAIDALPTIPKYQRVNTATDYDTIGFPTYLLYDGVDDGYATAGNVDFSATDKMTVWAGVTKLSDAARGMFLIHDNAGTQRIDIEIPSAGLGDYLTQCGGTLLRTASVAAAAPETSVLTVNENIAGDSLILRRDGAQVSASAADQGAGNFSNTPLYVGKTGAGTLPFNGREYGLIIRGAQSTSTEIVQFEDYMAQKAGVAPL